MRRIMALIIAISITIIGVVGGTAKPAEAPSVTVIKVGATPIPHVELLNFVKPLLEKENIKLEIVQFQDYVQPNTALVDKELDANFFQHQPYLDSFNKETNQNLISATVINTNYALSANLNPVSDALFIEGKDSPYANIIVVRNDDEQRPEIKKLISMSRPKLPLPPMPVE